MIIKLMTDNDQGSWWNMEECIWVAQHTHNKSIVVKYTVKTIIWMNQHYRLFNQELGESISLPNT